MTSTNFEMENYHLMEEQILILMPFFSLEMMLYKKAGKSAFLHA
jgi:hypothetical protein